MSDQEQAERGETRSPLVQFRVRAGCRFGAANQYGPGDVVMLPASAAAAFGDKLEAVGDTVDMDRPESVAPEDAQDAPKPRQKTKR